jgi:hypothetical protein
LYFEGRSETGRININIQHGSGVLFFSLHIISVRTVAT